MLAHTHFAERSGWSLEILRWSPVWSAMNANGVPSRASPGLRGTSYPGNPANTGINPGSWCIALPGPTRFYFHNPSQRSFCLWVISTKGGQPWKINCCARRGSIA